MSPRRRLSQERRVQILEAAARVIVQRGLADTRIVDVAEAAGTSPGLVLYYFESKDRLLAEALTVAEERFYEETLPELARIESARDRLVRLIELTCSNEDSAGLGMDEYLLWLDLWARAPRDGLVASKRQELDLRWRTALASIVGDGQDRGEFDAVDPEEFALRFAAIADGLTVLVVLSDPEMTLDRMREILLATAERELGFDASGSLRRTRAGRSGRPKRRATVRTGAQTSDRSPARSRP
jgi:AcrR family transcriptional regulator